MYIKLVRIFFFFYIQYIALYDYCYLFDCVESIPLLLYWL